MNAGYRFAMERHVTKKQERAVRSGTLTRQPTMIDRRIGVLIRERRLAQGLNQQQLADRIGTAVQQLHKYETGENRVSASRLVDIARELNVAVAWFFEQREAPNLADDDGPSGARLAEELLTLFHVLRFEDQRKLIEIARLLGR